MIPLISIIIVNWNEKKYLEKCLQSLYKQVYRKFEIIVVDNASSDQSVAYIKENFPSIKIIRNRVNLGFAEANNIGYKEAKGKYILFLNNDTYVEKDFLNELVSVLEQDIKIGGAQSKILVMEKRDTLDSVGSFFTSTGFLYHYGALKKNSKKYDKQINIFSAKGACMIFKREVLEEVQVNGELFDGRYFAYFEETDMCHRVWLAGYKIVFVPSSIIYHKMGGTSTKLDNAFVQYHSFKNRINSYTKNLSPRKIITILPLHLLIVEVIAVLFILKLKPKLFFAINAAIIWNVKNIKCTLLKRNVIQSHIRKVKDKSIFQIITRSVFLNYYYHLFVGDIEKYEDP